MSALPTAIRDVEGPQLAACCPMDGGCRRTHPFDPWLTAAYGGFRTVGIDLNQRLSGLVIGRDDGSAVADGGARPRYSTFIPICSRTEVSSRTNLRSYCFSAL